MVLVAFICGSLNARFSMRGKTSSIQINSGATLNIKNPISMFEGTLIKNVGATISGSPITFSNEISQAASMLNNNQSDLQTTLRQLTLLQANADIVKGIFKRPYNTQIIQVSGTTQFTLSMLPAANQTTVIEFPQYYDPTDIPELVFNNLGNIELATGSRLIISGIGIVELVGTNTFIFDGTPNASATVKGPDWAELQIEQGALMHVAQGSSVAIGAGASGSHAGRFGLYNNAILLMDESANLIFGGVMGNQLMVNVDAGSAIQLNHAQAQISACDSILDFRFDRYSALKILNGTFEINTQTTGGITLPQPANIRNLTFANGSSLSVHSQGSNTGLLRIAPNVSDGLTNFDSTKAVIYRQGSIQLLTFSGNTIATNQTLPLLSKNIFVNVSMEDLFTDLTT